jgi:hypothetical protein
MSANSRESANRCEATDGEASIPKDEDFTNPHSSLDSEITTYENRQFDFQTVMATIVRSCAMVKPELNMLTVI